MPYISAADKIGYEVVGPSTVGQLTYGLTRECQRFVKLQRSQGPGGVFPGPLRFVTIAFVLGALLATALEFYRRVAAPYEDEKIQENGDVY